MGGKGDSEKGFLDFSKFLIQKDEYVDHGKKAAQKIFDALKDSSTYGLQRFSSASTFGKDLAGIAFSDHDLSIFVNDEDPIFEDITDDFEQVLNDFAESSGKDEPIQVFRNSRYSLGLNVNGYKFNLYPAANYVTTATSPPEAKTKKQSSSSAAAPNLLIAEQAHKTLQKLEKDSSKAHHHSSSLCETHFEFMSRQSAFVLSLVRLCKFWNQSLLIPDNFGGRLTLIELIAVSVGVKEEKLSKKVQQTELILKAFQKFLQHMVNFNDLAVDFKDFDPLKSLRSKGVSWKPSSFDPDLRSSPYVIEPANPFNNLAKAAKESHIELFKLYAAETLTRLDKAMKNPKNIVIDSIFQPQPLVVPFKSKSLFDFFKKAEFVFDVEADGPGAGGGGGGGGGDDDDEDDYSDEESEEEFDEGGGSEEEELPFCPVMEIHKKSNKKYTLAETQEGLRHIQLLFSVIGQSFAYSYAARHRKLDLEKARKCLKARLQRSVDLGIKSKGQQQEGDFDDEADENGPDSDEDDEEEVDHEKYDVSFEILVPVPGGKLEVAISFKEV